MAAIRQRRPSPRRSSIRPAHFTPADVAGLWRRNGGPKKYANAMATVSALGENRSGDPNVVNSIGATGLFQIYPGGERYKNPDTNARAAVAKFRAAKARGGTGFEPWKSSEGSWGSAVDKKTGKVDGIVSKQLGLTFQKSGAEAFATGKIGDAIAGAIKPLEPLQTVGQLALTLTNFLVDPNSVRRLLKITIGSVILLWALNQLAKAMLDVNPASGIRKTATKVAAKGVIK